MLVSQASDPGSNPGGVIWARLVACLIKEKFDFLKIF